MKNKRRLMSLGVGLVASSAALVSCGSAEVESREWLFVQTATNGDVVSASTLELPVEDLIFGFTDRPDREFRQLPAEEFAALWDASNEDGFAGDPPNAVMTWRDGDQITIVEVVLETAEYRESDGVIAYDVTVESGTLPTGELGPVSLFVDGAYTGYVSGFDEDDS